MKKEQMEVHVALEQARYATNSIATDLRDLLAQWTNPCPPPCQHENCPVLWAVRAILENRRAEIANASGALAPRDAVARVVEAATRTETAWIITRDGEIKWITGMTVRQEPPYWVPVYKDAKRADDGYLRASERVQQVTLTWDDGRAARKPRGRGKK